MTNRIFILVSLLLVVFQSHSSFAQNDLTLDDSFAVGEPPPQSTDGSASGAIPPDTSELNLDSPDALTDPSMQSDSQTNMDIPSSLDKMVDTPSVINPDEMSTQNSLDGFENPSVSQNAEPTENVNLASPIEVLQHENALYGFSVGFVYSSFYLRENYMIETDFIKNSPDRETDNIQSAGVMFRYAVVPFYGLGTDINVSYSKSQNHKSVTVQNTKQLSEVSVLKGELNFTYAMSLGRFLPIYFLAGIGVEKVNGAEVEKILNPMGYGGQAGGGITIASSLNLEAVYSYYAHRISNDIPIAISSQQADKTRNYIDTEEGEIVNQGLIVRGTYSFKF